MITKSESSKKRLLLGSLAGVVVMTAIGLAYAQWRRPVNEDGTPVDRRGVPDWEVASHMPDDVFTFVRLRYDSYSWRPKWQTDYPDSDLNFSYRLQELTSLEVNPDGLVLDATDPRLFDYPFLYMIEPGEINLSEAEAGALRKWMLNGGFLMIDDFWGDEEYDGFLYGWRRIFPEARYQPKELPITHEIFRTVFELKEKPQVPAMELAIMGRERGITWEERTPNTETPHYLGVFDDEGRLMCIVCHNTDLGDGWEREGDNHWYFKEFAEKKAYPMGINIVFYALTH